MASFTDITNETCSITDISSSNGLTWCSTALWCGDQTWCGTGFGFEFDDYSYSSSSFVDI